MNRVNRVNLILNNPDYIGYVELNEKYEMDRIYCKHDLQHFFDVARIAYIINLEEGLDLSKEIIYTAALLHDIGRWQQYESGIPHEISSAELALDILTKCDYNEEEISKISYAIRAHRGPKDQCAAGDANYIKNNNHNFNKDYEENLSRILRLSDKLSRNCLQCKAKFTCNWLEEKKNLYIEY